MMEAVLGPWPWWVAGPLIGLVVPFVFWYGGRKWGVSSSLQHLCAATVPAGLEYFRYDWRKRGGWHLAMAVGMVVGGLLAVTVLSGPEPLVVEIAPSTAEELRAMGITDFTGMLPSDLFSWGGLASLPGVIVILVGGFLVGFGARYGGGCTSGHAISGLSTLQVSSLIATLGFFAGGLISAHLLLARVLGL
jgi:uncharacterized membrane protein YedE/YeeE